MVALRFMGSVACVVLTLVLTSTDQNSPSFESALPKSLLNMGRVQLSVVFGTQPFEPMNWGPGFECGIYMPNTR